MSIYNVYYAKAPAYRAMDPPPALEDLPQTHVLLCKVEAENKDDVFRQMQGENWSPNGEARPLIKGLGLTHTSMSVNDVVQDESGVYWECVDVGWREIKSEVQHG